MVSKHDLKSAFMSFSLKSRFLIGAAFILAAALFLVAIYQLNQGFLKETPIAGGEIKEGLVGAPRFANPLLSITDSDRDLVALVYNGLLRSDGKGGFIPDLAKSYTVSEDGKTYTVILKDNLIWHDKAPLTASDILYTIKLAKDPNTKSSHRAEWEGVTVSSPDPKTIIFTLKQPFAGFLDNLTLGILPEHIWKNTDSANIGWNEKNINPIGAGAYKISDINRDRDGIPTAYHLTPFPNFALGVPKLLLTLNIYPNESRRESAFANGEINSLAAIPADKIKTIAENNDIKIFRGSQPRMFAVFFNQNEQPLLAERELRRYLSQNVDRQKLIKEVLFGFGGPIYGPLPQNTDINLAATTSETSLTKAGIKKNDQNELVKVTTTVTKSGKSTVTKKSEDKITLTISTANSPELKQIAELVATDWRKLGVDTSVKIYDQTELTESVIRPRKYEALLFGLNVDRDNDLFPFWHSSQRLDPGVNVAMYANPKTDKLLEDARATINAGDRDKKYNQVITEIVNDAPAAFLFKTDYTYALPVTIKGVQLGTITTGAERFNNVYEWYQNTEWVWPFFINTK